MTLCDTGPLIALLDAEQGDIHLKCVEALRVIRRPLVLTWPVITETMYFAQKLGGWPLQNLLWRHLADSAAYLIHDHDRQEIERVRVLMEQYRDAPMDLGDASIVVACEALGTLRVFTLDSHFTFYRTRTGAAFEIFPAASV